MINVRLRKNLESLQIMHNFQKIAARALHRLIPYFLKIKSNKIIGAKSTKSNSFSVKVNVFYQTRIPYLQFCVFNPQRISSLIFFFVTVLVYNDAKFKIIKENILSSIERALQIILHRFDSSLMISYHFMLKNQVIYNRSLAFEAGYIKQTE